MRNTLCFFLAVAGLNGQANRLPRFGVYDLAAGDTFRLNLTSPANKPIPGDPCRVQATVFQNFGSTFGTCTFGVDFCPLPLGNKTMTLSPGTSDGLEFSAFGALTVWPVLTLPAGVPGNPCRDLTGSIEVYDTASKRSRLLDLGRGLAPDPPPIFPLAGLTSLDTIRVNLIFGSPEGPPITPADRCTVQAAIQGADGTTLGTPTTMTLTPFQFTSLSYSNAAIAGRLLVRPVIGTQPGEPCRNVQTTVELQDSSGRTFAMAPEGPPI
jgi:hypothetical protein